MFLVLTPILLLHFFIYSSYGASFNSNETGTCNAKEGRIQLYESEGKTPDSAYLELCKMFHGKTCCSASQLNSISSSLENLATYGEAVKDCLELFEILECSICHRHVGISLRISALFCDRVFAACSEAYFSSDIINQVIVPCGSSKGIICGKASKWVSNGTEFCNAVGFTVQEADDSTEEPCFGSKSSLEPMVELGSLIKTEKVVKKMSFSVKICWVFGIQINAFLRWRYEQQRIQAKIERDMRRFIRIMNRVR